jgi:NIPSNAP protein
MSDRTKMKAGSDSPTETCCPVVELRQYTLHPGKRDVLIDLFDREFVEPQEAVGMKIIGQFRDLDDCNRFVWLRGFPDMPSRAQALQDFYGGPIWKTHRETANATMIDSDNVLLLRPASPGAGFSLDEKIRPSHGASEIPRRLILATIYYFDAPVSDDFVEFFESTIKPVTAAAGAPSLAYFVSEQGENTFPALPVREGENVFVWFARFSDADACDRYLATLEQSQLWREKIAEELVRRLEGTPEILKLSPTRRSLL